MRPLLCTEVTALTLPVPVFDLVEWKAADAERRDEMAEIIDASLRQTGTFLLSGHGVPADLSEELRVRGRTAADAASLDAGDPASPGPTPRTPAVGPSPPGAPRGVNLTCPALGHAAAIIRDGPDRPAR